MRIPTFNQFQSQSDYISVQFNSLMKLQEQATTGLKIQQSSEDPVLAAQIKSSQDFINVLQSYSNNSTLAQNRANAFSTSMQSVSNTMQDITVQLTQAKSTGTLSADTKKAIVAKLQGDLQILLSAANKKDADGSYIFSGISGTTMPFSLINGTYQYQGSYTSSNIDIAPNVNTLYNEVGDNVFGNMYNGNGTFTVTAGAGNTGSAVGNPGSVNSSSYVADNYTITFSGSPGSLTYTITGVKSGTVVSNVPFTPNDQSGTNINFNGITFNVTGTPAAGDTLQIQPSTPQNIFNTVQSVINLLSSTTTSATSYTQQLSQLSSTLTGMTSSLTNYQSQAGIRLAAINAQIQASQTDNVTQQKNLSNLANADMPTVISALEQQSIALQTTQQSYLKLQDTLTQLLKL